MKQATTLALLATLLTFILTASVAQAGHITLNEKLSVESSVNEEEQLVSLKLLIEISNTGDETSWRTFPSFELGSYLYSAEEKNISAGASETWEITVDFPLEKLSCQSDSKCGEMSLPSKGRFPLLVTRNYQDANGYPFSTVAVHPVFIGNLSQEEMSILRQVPLRAKHSQAVSGKETLVSVTYKNSTAEPISGTSFVFASKELQINSAPTTFELSRQSSASLDYSLENFSGLPGSSYVSFIVSQFAGAGLRNTHHIPVVVTVNQPDSGDIFLISIIAVSLLSFLALYFVLRGRKA